MERLKIGFAKFIQLLAASDAGGLPPLLLGVVLRDARLHQFLDQRSRRRLIRLKTNRPLGGLEPLEILLVLHNQRSTHRQQAAMPGKSRETEEQSLITESGNAIADAFRGFRRNHGADDAANSLQATARRLRHLRKVGVYGFGSGLGVHLFHGESPGPFQQQKSSNERENSSGQRGQHCRPESRMAKILAGGVSQVMVQQMPVGEAGEQHASPTNNAQQSHGRLPYSM